MDIGSRLVRLIERDSACWINEWRTSYLSEAAQQMGGKAGKLPPYLDKAFLSNAQGIPSWYANPVYPISEEVYLALGGFWLSRFYRGVIEEESQGTYHISLWTRFSIEKNWSFAPNTEMRLSENPPAEFDLADRIGVPDWMPRPLSIPLPIPVIIPTQNLWSIYVPDEWAHGLETEGYAASFLVTGSWSRKEEFKARDRTCNGWDVGDITEGPVVTEEFLPRHFDPVVR